MSCVQVVRWSDDRVDAEMASTSGARPNWILVENKISSPSYVWGRRQNESGRSDPPRIDRSSSGRVIYHQPLLVASTSRAHTTPRDAQAKINAINRLNDRIQRRIASNYAGFAEERLAWPTMIPEEENEVGASEDARSADTALEGRRVVDESFGYLHDHDDTVGSSSKPQLFVPSTFVEVPPPIQTLPRIHSLHRRDPREDDETIYETSAAVISREPTRRESSRVQRLASQLESKSADPRKLRRRSDSLDSISLRFSGKELGRRWSIASGSVHLQPREFLTTTPVAKKPSLLKRDSRFYQSCDLCAIRGRPPSRTCPACGRSPTEFRNEYYLSPPRQHRRQYRSPSNRASTSPEDTRPQPLSAYTLRRNPAFYRPSVYVKPPALPPHRPPTLPRRTSRVTPVMEPVFTTTGYFAPSYSPAGVTATLPRRPWGYEAAPWATGGIPVPIVSTLPRRPPPSPVFRYGNRRLPEALYDYEVYAAQKRRMQARRKALALTMALLALALVIAAGVVLAAINY